jgi:hypothetical protein
MIGFLLKKTFFDLWDNLFRLALINIGFIASAAFPVLVPSLLEATPPLAIFAMFIGISWCFVYLLTAALSVKAISDYGSFGFAYFFRNLKAAWPAGIVMGFLAFILWIMLTVIIPFYLGLNSIAGLLLSALIFWTLIIGVLAFQFFPAVRARLDTKLSKVLKKCLIILLDNPVFCIFSLVHNVILLALSLFLVFLIPGPAGILLYLDEALRLRILKYDWLELNPAADRRRIPWDVLLIEEREKTGSRSFKSFIFPWKD